MDMKSDSLKKNIVILSLSMLVFMNIAGCGASDSNIQAEEKTISSLEQLSDDVFLLDVYTDYHVDDYLNADIKDVEQFDRWMTDTLTHGVPTGDIPDIGCSSFVVKGTNQNHLFGRNYDSSRRGESLIVRTMPKDGYASIGIVDLSSVNLGACGEYDIFDEAAGPLLFATPWCICDGINEKGLGVSLLELSNKHVVEDTDKGDLLIYASLRVLLDKCATIDEAVELLNSYDIYSPRPNTYHLFITDISGRSVVVEWENNQTFVVENSVVTNVRLNTEKVFDLRYSTIHKAIDEVNSMTAEEAMGVLDEVAQSTRWSAVYYLENFRVDICFNEDYSNVFSCDGQK